MTNFAMRIQKFAIAIGSTLESSWGVLSFAFFQILIFFCPIKFNIYLVGTLIVADVFTALAAMFMQEKRTSETLRGAFGAFYCKWTSRRAFDSIPKFVWYAILVILSFMVGTIFDEQMKVANLATGVIAYVEIRSIIENGDKAFGTNLWELVADGLQKFFKLK